MEERIDQTLEGIQSTLRQVAPESAAPLDVGSLEAELGYFGSCNVDRQPRRRHSHHIEWRSPGRRSGSRSA